ncbi:hypothetical protein BDC45DRAFT_537233 [Circinella umbellata]|nr:hypothetical protein BDC45DRAFT_537233 [Circinella umbellata]
MQKSVERFMHGNKLLLNALRDHSSAIHTQQLKKQIEQEKQSAELKGVKLSRFGGQEIFSGRDLTFSDAFCTLKGVEHSWEQGRLYPSMVVKLVTWKNDEFLSEHLPAGCLLRLAVKQLETIVLCLSILFFNRCPCYLESFVVYTQIMLNNNKKRIIAIRFISRAKMLYKYNI